MGHLVNPIAFRLGYKNKWKASWVQPSKSLYRKYLHNDLLLYKFLNIFFRKYTIPGFTYDYRRRMQYNFDLGKKVSGLYNIIKNPFVNREFSFSHVLVSRDKGLGVNCYFFDGELETWRNMFFKTLKRPSGKGKYIFMPEDYVDRTKNYRRGLIFLTELERKFKGDPKRLKRPFYIRVILKNKWFAEFLYTSKAVLRKVTRNPRMNPRIGQLVRNITYDKKMFFISFDWFKKLIPIQRISSLRQKFLYQKDRLINWNVTGGLVGSKIFVVLKVLLLTFKLSKAWSKKKQVFFLLLLRNLLEAVIVLFKKIKFQKKIGSIEKIVNLRQSRRFAKQNLLNDVRNIKKVLYKSESKSLFSKIVKRKILSREEIERFSRKDERFSRGRFNRGINYRKDERFSRKDERFSRGRFNRGINYRKDERFSIKDERLSRVKIKAPFSYFKLLNLLNLKAVSYKHLDMYAFERFYETRYYMFQVASNAIRMSIEEIDKNTNVKISFLGLSMFNVTASHVTNYILFKLRNFFSINQIVKPLLREFQRKNIVKSYRIMVVGRLTRKQRAWHLIRQNQGVTLGSKKLIMDYSQDTVALRFGAVGVKVWLVYYDKNPYFYKLNFAYK